MIQKASVEDLDCLAELAIQMWRSHTLEELKNEFTEIMECHSKDHAALLLKECEQWD